MSKKQAVLIIVISMLLCWLFGVTAGRFLTAKLSTWPLLNRLQILSPQAPIVITNHETVRVNDSGDAVAEANNLKSKLSSVVYVTASSSQMVGGSLNLTNDGDFVTGASTFGKSVDGYWVVLNDGRSAKITFRQTDRATGLVFFKANISGVPTANFGASADLNVGEKLIFAYDSLQNYFINVYLTTVASSQKDVSSRVFSSDVPSRTFLASALDGNLISGEAAVNSSGEIVGLWNGSAIVSSDVLKPAINLYLAAEDKAVLSRPAFGFTYSIVTKSQSALTGTAEGAAVREVKAASAAHSAGLLAGDVITRVDGRDVGENSPLEEILQKYKAGDKIILTVSRKNQNLNLTLIPTEQK